MSVVRTGNKSIFHNIIDLLKNNQDEWIVIHPSINHTQFLYNDVKSTTAYTLIVDGTSRVPKIYSNVVQVYFTNLTDEEVNTFKELLQQTATSHNNNNVIDLMELLNGKKV